MPNLSRIYANSDCRPEAKLKEFVGHTPLQVIAGILLGVANTFIMYYCVL